MRCSKTIGVHKIIASAIGSSQYCKGNSKLNKKWCRYLKDRKLFDDYMIYLANRKAVGTEPETYQELSNICYNLCAEDYRVYGDNGINEINVNWVCVFKDFAWNSIKWYDIKNIYLYIKNNGYL